MGKLFIILGAVNAGLATVFGAFGAHALQHRLAPDLLVVYETGVQYHFYHALGLIMTGLIAMYLSPSVGLKWSGWLMLGGMIAFSGSLYLLAITGNRWLGAITPVGGIALITAWLLLAYAVYREFS